MEKNSAGKFIATKQRRPVHNDTPLIIIAAMLFAITQQSGAFLLFSLTIQRFLLSKSLASQRLPKDSLKQLKLSCLSLIASGQRIRTGEVFGTIQTTRQFPISSAALANND